MASDRHTDSRPDSRSDARPDPVAVQRAIDEINVMMESHAGRIVLDRVGDDGAVEVRFDAFCSGCLYRPATMASTIRPRLLQVPGVTRVVAPGARISDAAAQRFVDMGFGLQAPRTTRSVPLTIVPRGPDDGDGS